MKNFFALITACIIIISTIRIPRSEAENCSAYVLVEASTQTVLEEENSDKELNCGSLSKLMTILLIAEDIETGRFALSDILTAPNNVTGTKGAVIWLESGDKISVEELLKAVIIGNANDAVTTLAVASRQSVENFTSEMNRKAFEVGLRHTTFYSPYGYYDEREHSTARDIAIICAELTQFDFLEPYFKTRRDFIKNGATELVTENKLTDTFKQHIGFKASHSEQSGYCIAEGGRSESGDIFIAVVLGAESEDSSFPLAKKLVNKGFNGYKVTVPGFLDELLLPLKVKHGVEGAVELQLRSQSSIVIPKGTAELKNKVILPEYISAPVKKGQKIGAVGFYNKDTLVFETEIVTKNSVKKIGFGFVFKKMLSDLLKK